MMWPPHETPSSLRCLRRDPVGAGTTHRRRPERTLANLVSYQSGLIGIESSHPHHCRSQAIRRSVAYALRFRPWFGQRSPRIPQRKLPRAPSACRHGTTQTPLQPSCRPRASHQSRPTFSRLSIGRRCKASIASGDEGGRECTTEKDQHRAIPCFWSTSLPCPVSAGFRLPLPMPQPLT